MCGVLLAADVYAFFSLVWVSLVLSFTVSAVTVCHRRVGPEPSSTLTSSFAGHGARALVLKAAGGDGTRLEYMSARFTSPVMPGDEVRSLLSAYLHSLRRADIFHLQLETSMWISSDEKTGGTRVDFVQKIQGSGKVCLGGGVALFKKANGQSKL